METFNIPHRIFGIGVAPQGNPIDNRAPSRAKNWRLGDRCLGEDSKSLDACVDGALVTTSDVSAAWVGSVTPPVWPLALRLCADQVPSSSHT